jgi:hypothetical protein
VGVVPLLRRCVRRVQSKRGKWCAQGWVEITEFIAVVPQRSQSTDLNGNDYPFKVRRLLPLVAGERSDTHMAPLLVVVFRCWRPRVRRALRQASTSTRLTLP